MRSDACARRSQRRSRAQCQPDVAPSRGCARTGQTDASKWSARGTDRVLPVILARRTSALLVLLLLFLVCYGTLASYLTRDVLHTALTTVGEYTTCNPTRRGAAHLLVAAPGLGMRLLLCSVAMALCSTRHTYRVEALPTDFSLIKGNKGIAKLSAGKNESRRCSERAV